MPMNKGHPTAEVEAVARAIEQRAADDWANKVRDNWRGYAEAAIEALSTKESDLSADNERLREELRKARELAVLFLAFDGRDRGSSRMDRTLDDLCAIAVKVDSDIRAALQGSAS